MKFRGVLNQPFIEHPASVSLRNGWSIYCAVMHPDPAARRRARQWIRETELTEYGWGYFRSLVSIRRKGASRG